MDRLRSKRPSRNKLGVKEKIRQDEKTLFKGTITISIVLDEDIYCKQ